VSDPTAASYDLLVVGGGINGVGIARDAAGRGLKVLLCEQDDLAAHTSSASTKLIHGGLRYLEEFHFSLVRKALRERAGITAGVIITDTMGRPWRVGQTDAAIGAAVALSVYVYMPHH